MNRDLVRRALERLPVRAKVLISIGPKLGHTRNVKSSEDRNIFNFPIVHISNKGAKYWYTYVDG